MARIFNLTEHHYHIEVGLPIDLVKQKTGKSSVSNAQVGGNDLFLGDSNDEVFDSIAKLDKHSDSRYYDSINDAFFIKFDRYIYVSQHNIIL